MTVDISTKIKRVADELAAMKTGRVLTFDDVVTLAKAAGHLDAQAKQFAPKSNLWRMAINLILPPNKEP